MSTGAGPGSQGLSHPSQEQLGSLGQWTPPWGWEQAKARTWAHGWAWIRGATAEQGCGKLETGPAVALLGQGLVDPGADMWLWAVGDPQAGQAGTVRADGAIKALAATGQGTEVTGVYFPVLHPCPN